ncbi:cupin-like domain-containing protein [Dactylosporangium sp. NPDC005572]|uniref:cupin-like domain-containing protein n=1 Tax=Dactylosporangium sp. NPDC005572 TaxID=3156889 RepID=UPI0033A31A65
MTIGDPEQTDDTASAGTFFDGVTIKLDAIDRVHNPSPEEFTRKYVYKRKPAIITGLMDSWPAMERWSLDYFRKHFGDMDIHANIQRLDDQLILGHVGKFKSMKFTDLLDLIEHSTEENRAHYLRAYPVHRMIEHYPELADDYDLPDLVPNWADIRYPAQWKGKTRNPAKMVGLWLAKTFLNRGSNKPAERSAVSSRVAAVMFVGSKGTVTPFHSDGMQTAAYLNQVVGRKRCYFVSPDQYECLYPRAFRRQFGMAQVDYRFPDLARRPKFRDVVVEETILYPGETLYVPSGYWHAIEAMDASISYSHQIVNEDNALGWLTCIPERYLAQVYFKSQGGLRNVTGAKDWDDWA